MSCCVYLHLLSQGQQAALGGVWALQGTVRSATGFDLSSPVEIQDKVENSLHKQVIQQQQHGNLL
jgi:hypothetical protein